MEVSRFINGKVAWFLNFLKHFILYRFYNNIFAANNDSLSKSEFYGLDAFNDFPTPSYQWKFTSNLNAVNKQQFPVYIDANLYLNKAKPSNVETNFVENRSLNPEINLSEEADGYYLNIAVDESFMKVKTKVINTEIMGAAFQSETPFENMDGSPITLNKDYFGLSRNVENPLVGPFENLKMGENKIKVWSK